MSTLADVGKISDKNYKINYQDLILFFLTYLRA